MKECSRANLDFLELGLTFTVPNRDTILNSLPLAVPPCCRIPKWRVFRRLLVEWVLCSAMQHRWPAIVVPLEQIPSPTSDNLHRIITDTKRGWISADHSMFTRHIHSPDARPARREGQRSSLTGILRVAIAGVVSIIDRVQAFNGLDRVVY